MSDVLFSPMIDHWTIAMLHFCWQGCAIAGTVAIAMRFFRSCNLRYVLLVMALLLCVACPIITTQLVHRTPHHLGTAGQHAVAPPQIIVAFEYNASSQLVYDQAFVPADSSEAPALRLSWKQWIFLVWFAGAFIFAVRLACGFFGCFRLRRYSDPAPKRLQEIHQQLATSFRFRKPPRILVSPWIRDAVAVGLLRPLVLIPLSWATEFPPDLLRAAIAHELSHIRRFDLWINTVQRLVETMLFFHPAVWWISRRIRHERELGCDQFAARMLNSRIDYAKALEKIAHRQNGFSFQQLFCTNLGDDRMSLLQRIKHVLEIPSSNHNPKFWPLGVVALMAPVLMVWNTDSTATEPPPAVELVDGKIPVHLLTPGESSSPQATPNATANSPDPRDVKGPSYVIAPPDIVGIQAIRLIPRASIPNAVVSNEIAKVNYKLGIGDYLKFKIESKTSQATLSGSLTIDDDGNAFIGPDRKFKLRLAGVTLGNLHDALTRQLPQPFKKLDLHLNRIIPAPAANIGGEYLVYPDGTIQMGERKPINIAGKTISESVRAIQDELSKEFLDPKIVLDVLAPNSRSYYIIFKGTKDAQLIRVPYTGNETVLDALSQTGGLHQTSDRKIWIARPARSGETKDQILHVDYEAITKGADTATNYRLCHGDRVFIGAPSLQSKPLGLQDSLKEFIRLVEQNNQHEAAKLLEDLHQRHPKNAVVQLMRAHLILKLSSQTENPIPARDAPVSLIVKTYNVKDFTTKRSHPVIRHPNAKAAATNRDSKELDFKTVINLIMETVCPDDWESHGGSFAIQAFPANGSLVVSASPPAHQEISDLFHQLRQVQRRSTISINAQFLRIGSNLVTKLGIEQKKIAVLTPDELQTILNGVKSDPYSRNYALVQTTAFSGEPIRIHPDPRHRESLEINRVIFVLADDTSSLQATIGAKDKQHGPFPIQSGSVILCRVTQASTETSPQFLILRPSVKKSGLASQVDPQQPVQQLAR